LDDQTDQLSALRQPALWRYLSTGVASRGERGSRGPAEPKVTVRFTQLSNQREIHRDILRQNALMLFSFKISHKLEVRASGRALHIGPRKQLHKSSLDFASGGFAHGPRWGTSISQIPWNLDPPDTKTELGRCIWRSAYEGWQQQRWGALYLEAVVDVLDAALSDCRVGHRDVTTSTRLTHTDRQTALS